MSIIKQMDEKSVNCDIAAGEVVGKTSFNY